MKNDDSLKRTDVRLERQFDTPPSRVFHAWTDPATMSRWMWAGLGGDVWAEVDLRVGGAYRIYTRHAGGRHQGEDWSGMAGIYVDIVADRRLVYTLHWDADVEYNRPDRLTLDEVISVDLAPDGERTSLVYRHLGIPDDGVSAGGHRAGVNASFDILATLLRT